MGKRKAISNKLRFEVFKRDSFKCQYCGQSAPDVILEVDHIKPVKKGGENVLINLITSCQECNSGKGARELGDRSVVDKQRKQLEELNERREQLRMMMQWREELLNLESEKQNLVIDRIQKATGYTLNEYGIQDVTKLLKKFPLDIIFDAIDASISQYLEPKTNGKGYTSESFNKAFDYIGRICTVMKRKRENPELAELYLIRGKIRNKCGYFKDWEALSLLKQAYELGASLDDLNHMANGIKCWSHFTNEMDNLISYLHKR